MEHATGEDPSGPQPLDLCRVAIRPPPFWPDKPALWFDQMESQFSLAGVKNDITMYNHVISHLDHRYAAEVEDIIINPPATGRYERIKSELIRRLSISREQRVRQLMMHEEMGDRKPSQFLRYLKSLAGSEVSDDFMRSLWSNRLPSHIQVIIASQTTTTLNEVAELADNINEIVPQPRVATIGAADTSAIMQRLDELTAKVSSLSADRQRGRSPSRSRFRNERERPPRRSSPYPWSNDTANDHCWYHRRFGTEAKRCTAPCTFAQENTHGSR
ncbi:uncharacterized protein LOC124163805 [Ischnura elegans]|uniref:uncharacterized protein LOC124163805 n=1 Tax=Ischnura elegans TaxID=197161 RepID=UPI001ED8AAE4|nr:uncharacterized protein LOC124163805 [Ischnura elegans]